MKCRIISHHSLRFVSVDLGADLNHDHVDYAIPRRHLPGSAVQIETLDGVMNLVTFENRTKDDIFKPLMFGKEINLHT